jgi:hypothetical protein
VINAPDLAQLDAQQLRDLVHSMHVTIERRDREIAFKQALIDKMTHEMAVLKRLKFAAQSERVAPEQRNLLEETIDTDIAALELELENAKSTPADEREKRQPKRQPLPADLPRTEHRHEPDNTHCSCGCALKRIGEG